MTRLLSTESNFIFDIYVQISRCLVIGYKHTACKIELVHFFNLAIKVCKAEILSFKYIRPRK